MIDRLVVPHRMRWELAAAALLVAVVTLVIAGGSWFDRDDLLFASYFEVNPITLDALVRSWFGHLMPGYIASVIAFLTIFGLSWPAALLFIALIHAGAFVALTRCLDAVLGTSRLNILVALAFSLSLGPLAVRLWWAATLNNMLALGLGLAVLGSATRWVVTRRRRYLVGALLVYALALSMSEKNLLFSVHVAAWCFLVVWRAKPLAERVRETLRAWPLWLGIAALSLIDVIAFLAGSYVDESGEAAGLLFSVAFVVQGLIGGLIPSLFGIEMADEPTSLVDPRVLIPALLLAAFIAWTIVKARSTAGVWLFALIVVGVNGAVLSRRGEMLGVGGGRSLRYLLESTALLWLAIGVALVLALRAVARSADHRIPRRMERRIAVGAAATGLVAVFAVSAWSWASTLTRTIDNSGGYAARDWMDRLSATLPHPAPPLVDSPLPTSFGMPALHPYDMVGVLMPRLGWSDAQITNSLDGAWVVGADGTAGPAILEATATPVADRRCTDGSSSIAIPEVRSDGREWVVVDYSEGSGDSMALQTNAGWTTISGPVDQGRVAVYIAAPLDGDLSIASQGGPLCVDAVTTGHIVPAETR